MSKEERQLELYQQAFGCMMEAQEWSVGKEADYGLFVTGVLMFLNRALEGLE